MAERRSRKSGLQKATDKLFKSFGMGDVDTSALVNPFTGEPVGYKSSKEDIADEIERAALRRRLEAESVLAYVDTKGAGFQEKKCKKCEEVFAHTLMPVEYCSDLCRAASLAEIGVGWNIYGKTDVERWGGRIPKVLEPEALKAAKFAMEAREAAFQIALQQTLDEMDIAAQEEEAALIELGELEEDGMIFPTEEDED